MAGLLEFVQREEGLRVLFGQQELNIIEKQLLGVELSKSESTRLSRDIRKKLKVVGMLCRFSDEFDLKKGARVKELIEEAKEVILKSEFYPRIKKIILFGSTVENARTHRSDVDIAVEFDEIASKDAGRFRIYVLGRVHDSIDVQVYNVLPEKIKKEININGKVLWKKGDFIDRRRHG